MKILRIASDLYPSVIGGAALHAHNMSMLQANMENDVTVYTVKQNDRPYEEIVSHYMIERFKPLIKVYGNPIVPSLFFRLMAEKKRFDIIHAHSHLYLSTNFCSLIRKLSSTPLVITNHGLTSQTAPDWLNSFYLATVGKWTLKAADQVICYTEEEKKEMEKLGVDARKIRVIHNGIDTSLFKPADKHGDGNRLLWIGRFVPGKGVDYLIEAFAEAVKEKPDLRLMMVGNGPQIGAIKDKIRTLGLDAVITIKEFVPNQELPAVYQSADIFILSSLAEGVPRTILEAMSCGLPIICTDLPQLRHIVDRCGLMVPVKDAKELAKAILKVASDVDLARELGICGRERVMKSYSWDDTVQKTLLLYHDIIESRSVRHYESERCNAHPSGRTI
jgi:glycosyltransferase involved in cell wall biosynthesis